MKRLSLFAVAMLAFVACSQNEEMACQETPFMFRMNQQNTLRSTVEYNSTNLPDSFMVEAIYTAPNGDKKVYFKSGAARVGNTNSYELVDGSYFWPAEGTLSFYAYAFAGDLTLSEGATSEKMINFSNPTDDSQSDFIYAVTTDCSKATHSAGVNLFFKQALSQIRVAAINRNPTTTVEINYVRFVDLAGESGSIFHFPTTTTAADNDIIGSWSGNTNSSAYWHAFESLWYDGSNNVMIPTSATDAAELLSNNLRMVPQKADQVRMLVNCTIKTAGVINFSGEREVIIVNVDWNPGVCYTYNLIFDKGEGMTTLINFSVDVNDYVSVPDEDLEV